MTQKFQSFYRTLFLIVFFFSGLSALVYQTVWIRQFGLVFGVDIFAAATVLTAFMAGLALGNLLFGKIVDKKGHTFYLFIGLQIGVGLFALLFPVFFSGLQQLITGLSRNSEMSFMVMQLVRFVLAFLFLLIPTTLMGGTLPVISKIFVRKLNTLGWNVGRLYSVNNLGAFVGAFLAGFILMRTVGLRNAVLAAAGLNLLNAVLVYLLSLKQHRILESGEPEKTPAEEPTHNLPSGVVKFVLWAFAIEGFTTLAYEVLWTRILIDFSYDKSVYFYTTVILSFIFGLSIGSIIIAKITDKKRNLLALFGIIEGAIGICSILVLIVFSQTSQILSELRLTYENGWWATLGKEYLLFFLTMIIPTTLMGMTFPVVSKICVPHLRRLGSRIGQIGFLDTVGSIFGAFAAGFILIPVFGVINAVVATAFINLVIGIISFLINPELKASQKTAFTSATAVLAVIVILTIPKAEYFRHWQTEQQSDRLLYYNEGPDATIAVPQHTNGTKFLSINGSVTAFANYGDTRVHKMLGYLPYALHADPDNALVVGLGMGITAQSLIQPDIRHVDCVELNPGVVDAAADYFTQENDSIVAKEKFNLIIDDGRSYLVSTAKKYDIITSNAVHARLSSNLYTQEFYQICRQHLNRDGVMCQWISTNWLTPREYKSLIKAFNLVFPHTSLWAINAGHVLMIGTPEPLRIDYNRLNALLNRPKAQKDLKRYDLAKPASFLCHFVTDERRLPEFVQDAPPHTDNFPRAEFSHVVSKMQIPQVVLGLIRLKYSAADHIIFTAPVQEPVDSLRARITRYAEAERYYLEGVYSRNFHQEAVLAEQLFLSATSTIPDEYRYHEELASLYFINDRFDLAIEHLQKIVDLHPDFAWEWQHLGHAYLSIGELKKAENAFHRAIDLAPEYPFPRVYMASIYGNRGEYERAEEELLTVIEHWPDLVEAYYRLGLVYEILERPKKAVNMYRQVEKLQENYRDAAGKIQKLTKAD